MFENVTVTLSLNDFDKLREGETTYRLTARALAACFDYTCTQNPTPQECENCPSANNDYSLPSGKSGMIHDDCAACAVFQKHNDYNELLTVDVERLIRTAKEYAVYGKDVETDLDKIEVQRKAEG